MSSKIWICHIFEIGCFFAKKICAWPKFHRIGVLGFDTPSTEGEIARLLAIKISIKNPFAKAFRSGKL